MPHFTLSSLIIRPTREWLCPFDKSENEGQRRTSPCSRPWLVRDESRGCFGFSWLQELSPPWQPTVLAPGPALPLSYCGFGPLNLSFPICKMRAFKYMISISSMNISECPLCVWPSEGSEMDVSRPNPVRRESEGSPISQAPITCLIPYSHCVITLHYNSQIHAILS